MTSFDPQNGSSSSLLPFSCSLSRLDIKERHFLSLRLLKSCIWPKKLVKLHDSKEYFSRMAPKYLITFLVLLLAVAWTVSGTTQKQAPAATPTETKVPSTRQVGSSGLGNIFSLGGFSGMASAVMPILLAVGLGALVLPLLGGAIFLREGRKLDFPKISPAFLDNMADLLEKVVKAIETVENKY